MIPVRERDLLEQDPEIRGQSFGVVSFLNPEEIIKQKDVYYLEHFLTNFTKKTNEFINGLEASYPDESDKIRSIKEEFTYLINAEKIHDEYKHYVENNSSVLDKEFNEIHDYATNVRGIKLRGVYDSVQEAQVRCEHLKKLDNDKFSIYICQVGCWCPWTPNPNDVEKQEYATDSLNTLMHEYEKNLQTKDEYYAERKADLKNRITENEKTKKELRDQETNNEDINQILDQQKAISEIQTTLEAENVLTFSSSNSDERIARE